MKRRVKTHINHVIGNSFSLMTGHLSIEFVSNISDLALATSVEKIKHSKFDVFFLYKPFSVFYKGNHGQNEEIDIHL